MPNTVSAKKRVRQDEERALRNKARRTAMRGAIRKVRETVAAGDKAGAQSALQVAFKRIDKAARKHIIHENKAANQKRKLTRIVNAVG